MTKSCACSVCLMTQEYHRFAVLLPESERSRFKGWYSLIFEELEALTTSRDFEEYSKHKKKKIKMHTCYFKDLAKYDKRLQPVPGSVLVFADEKDWEAFIADSAPGTLANRGHLTVIVYDSFPDESTNA